MEASASVLLARATKRENVIGAVLCNTEGRVVEYSPAEFKRSAYHYTCVVASMMTASRAAFDVLAKSAAEESGGAEDTESILAADGAEGGEEVLKRERLSFVQFSTSEGKEVYVRTHDDLLLVVVSKGNQ